MAAFNGDYQQLAAALMAQHGVAAAAAGPPPATDPVAKYGGDRMDVERMESHVAKWLSDNCVDTNATVLQNVRSFMDHVSNVYKDKIALYETRCDMERLPSDAANPNAFSETVSRLCKEYNEAHPNWQAAGGDIRSGRFEHLPTKVAPCGLTARRHHGTKTGPTNGHTIGAGAAAYDESCRGMFATVGGVVHKSAFWQAHEQFPQRPEFCDFEPSAGANHAPEPFTVAQLLELEAVGVYAGFDLPSDRTFRHIALVMGDHFRTFCRTSRLFKSPLKCMAEIDAVNPQLCRNYFRTLVGIYTKAYKQDNYAIIDKVSKQFTEQIVMSVDLSLILFCESLVGCQVAIDKMTLRTDLRITDSDVLRKFIRGLTVVGHKSPTECDSMDAEYVKLYSRYNAYIECADPAVHADHDVFSTKDRLFAEIQAIHSRWSLSCPRNKTPPATWVAMTPDLMAPPTHLMHLSDDDMVYSLTTMDDANFDHILNVCENASDGYDPPDHARAHCDALLALEPEAFDSLLMARDFKMAGTDAASRQNQSNQLAIGNGTFARGPSSSGFGRGMPGRGRGRGAPRGGSFGRGPGPPPKGRNAPMGSYLTTYRPSQDHRNDAYHNSANTADRRQATVDKVFTDMRQNRDRMRTDQVLDRNAQRPTQFGRTTMLAPTARKAGQQIYSNVRLCSNLAKRGSTDPTQASMLCGRIVKVLDELYVAVDDMGASEIVPDAVLAVDDDEPAEVTADFLHMVMDKLDTSLSDEQKLNVLRIAGGIKSGAIHMLADHSSVDIEYSQLENEFGTEKFSDERHDTILLAGEQVHKSECKIFDSGASQNVEQERSMFIVYFPLKIPIPMKQGEGVLYATGVGIVMYNFKRDDGSVYSEPGFALHTPAGNKGMSIISKSSFQDLGFGYLAPPCVGATDF